jgi:hypothetical protein
VSAVAQKAVTVATQPMVRLTVLQSARCQAGVRETPFLKILPNYEMILSQFEQTVWHGRSSDGDVAEARHHKIGFKAAGFGCGSRVGYDNCGVCGRSEASPNSKPSEPAAGRGDSGWPQCQCRKAWRRQRLLGLGAIESVSRRGLGGHRHS